MSCTVNMGPKLRRCFDYAKVELSNNPAENSMRPVALGRKNWLYFGSAKAGPKVAAILSVVEPCRRIGVPVKNICCRSCPELVVASFPKSPTYPQSMGSGRHLISLEACAY
jgi:transposase